MHSTARTRGHPRVCICKWVHNEHPGRPLRGSAIDPHAPIPDPPSPRRRAPFPAHVSKTDLLSSTMGAPGSAPWFLMLMAIDIAVEACVNAHDETSGRCKVMGGWARWPDRPHIMPAHGLRAHIMQRLTPVSYAPPWSALRTEVGGRHHICVLNMQHNNDKQSGKIRCTSGRGKRRTFQPPIARDHEARVPVA